MNIQVQAEHGIICSLPHDPLGYFGWPSVARWGDTLVAAASGLRTQHVCPFGKTVLFTSTDQGHTWSTPQIINNTPLDDRDAGILSPDGVGLLVSWFTSDTRRYIEQMRASYGNEVDRWQPILSLWTDELVNQWLSSWVRLSPDGRNWGAPIRVPVSTPHGPIRLHDGSLLYLGKRMYTRDSYQLEGAIQAIRSGDGGQTWEELGVVPLSEGIYRSNLHEPHVVELASGALLGLIRYQHSAEGKSHLPFSIFQTESGDGGRTWTPAHPLGVHGSPPHVLRHSSGALVCVYGRREVPYGQRAMISRDDGQTWDMDYILRDDGPDGDLGYPASVELDDGSLCTVYYQKLAAGEKCSLLWTRWELPT